MDQENLNNLDGGGGTPTPIGSPAEETFIDIFGYNSIKMKKKIAKRYAVSMAKFQAGCNRAKTPDHLLGIVMTTKAGVRNEHGKLLNDYRHARRDLKALGLKFADCMVAEVSPESHAFRRRDGTMGMTAGNLWHLHGIWRFEEFQRAGELHSLLSPLWGKIHGSEIVNVNVIEDLKHDLDYALKDSLKGYCDERNWMRRLLISDAWLPPKYQEVQKVLWKWAVWHGAYWKDIENMEGYNLGEFIPMVKEVSRDYLYRWCHGESLTLEMPGGITMISGDNIVVMEEVK